jgi:hypothetical protein
MRDDSGARFKKNGDIAAINIEAEVQVPGTLMVT